MLQHKVTSLLLFSAYGWFGICALASACCSASAGRQAGRPLLRQAGSRRKGGGSQAGRPLLRQAGSRRKGGGRQAGPCSGRHTAAEEEEQERRRKASKQARQSVSRRKERRKQGRQAGRQAKRRAPQDLKGGAVNEAPTARQEGSGTRGWACKAVWKASACIRSVAPVL
eukprot:1161671-Pelagomonas_calceolata.AAC.36